MDNEYLDDHIDRCLSSISSSLYKLQDELIDMHNMVELITFTRQVQEKNSHHSSDTQQLITVTD